MKKKTAIWIKIIVLGILTLALIGILIVGILGNTFRNFPIFGSFSSYDNADLYQVGNADISASELSSLSIDWVSGSVKVDVYDGNVIQIREDGASDLSDSDKAHYYYHDGTLDVRYRESGSFFSFCGCAQDTTENESPSLVTVFPTMLSLSDEVLFISYFVDKVLSFLFMYFT